MTSIYIRPEETTEDESETLLKFRNISGKKATDLNPGHKHEQQPTPASPASVQFADPFLSSLTLHGLSHTFSSPAGVLPGCNDVCSVWSCVAGKEGSIGGGGGGGGTETGPSRIGGGGGGDGGGGGGGGAILKLCNVVVKHVTDNLNRVLSGSASICPRQKVDLFIHHSFQIFRFRPQKTAIFPLIFQIYH